MQVAQEMVSAATSSMQTKATSLRHFGRFGAVVVGILSGSVATANTISAREAAFKAKLSECEAEITRLQSANKTLEMEKAGAAEKPSSGDPVQDWIDSLNE